MRDKIIGIGRTTFASLTKRNFRLYFMGQSISLTGGWMQNVAQAWLILHLTHSGTALGIAAALQCGPMLLLGPYAGVLAGRFPKRRILLLTQSMAGLLALTLGILVATNTVQPWTVYVMAALLGVVNAIDYPVRQSFLYELVGPKELVSAVGLTATSVNLARVVGPAIAAVVIGGAGLAACFFLNAASFIAVLICLVGMRPHEFHLAKAELAQGGVREGVAYAARTSVVREAILMTAVVGVLTYEFSVTLPMLVQFTFKGGATGLAYLMSAMGVGAVVGGLVTAGRRDEGLDTLTMKALAFGVTTALVGLSPNLMVASALMFFVGVFSARFTGLSSTVLQLRSAVSMRSRVVALWSTAFVGSTLIGAPLLGWLGQTAGPRWALGAGALGGVIAAAIGWWGMRSAASCRIETIQLPAAASVAPTGEAALRQVG